MPLPEVRLCSLLTCRAPFTAMRYNALYCSIFCREKAHRQQEKAKVAVLRDARTVMNLALEKGWIHEPTTLMLDTKERQLVETNREGGFCFYGHVPEWTPKDERIMWDKTDQCWQMLYFPRVETTPAAVAIVPAPATTKPSRFDEMGVAAMAAYGPKPKI